VDVVVISHNHYDHLDVASVQALAAQAGGPPLFIVPLGLKAWFADLGIISVVELGWWQSHSVNGAEIVLTPAHHWSARGVFDRRQTLWGGFAVFAGDLRLLYTGDTGYADDFKDIRARFADRGAFDLALIPVGCYEPRDFMRDQHVNPTDAVRIFQDLGARRAVGVHWGTFADLCDEPLDQAPKDLAAARAAAGLADEVFSVMRRGETRPIN
jgi:N-acyl-phosphatidylethanolamine-hydrolysing phospholipase D